MRYQQVRRLAAVGFGNGQAYAQGQVAQRAGRVGEVERFESLLDPGGDMHAALQAGIGEDDCEFLAAIAAGAVAFALQAGAQDVRDLA
ncbi:hypothetical protein FQZ97_1002340 [compost metagenome]